MLVLEAREQLRGLGLVGIDANGADIGAQFPAGDRAVEIPRIERPAQQPRIAQQEFRQECAVAEYGERGAQGIAGVVVGMQRPGNRRKEAVEPLQRRGAVRNVRQQGRNPGRRLARDFLCQRCEQRRQARVFRCRPAGGWAFVGGHRLQNTAAPGGNGGLARGALPPQAAGVKQYHYRDA